MRTRLLTAAAAALLAGTVASCAAEPDPNADPVGCTAEQLTTLTAASGVPVSDDLVDAGSVTFEPESAIDGLATVCILTFESQGSTASFAVLPGGEDALADVTANLDAAGGEPAESDGHVSATVGDNTVVAARFGLVTEATDGFDDVDDLVVVISSPVSR